MKGRTQKTHEFSECTWKECPDYVNKDRKYLMNEKNQKAVTKENCDTYCTTIGNTHLPQSNATSWSIKILKSEHNDGCNVGVAPSDINQNDDDAIRRVDGTYAAILQCCGQTSSEILA